MKNAKLEDILAKNLRRLRNSTGLSQEELADRAGLHRTYVSSIERGERNITLRTVFVLAKALDVEPADLLKIGSDREPG